MIPLGAKNANSQMTLFFHPNGRLRVPRLAASLLLGLSSPAFGGFLSGSDLRGLCAEPTVACLSYLMGVVDGIDAMGWEGLKSPVCLPPTIDAAEVREIFNLYASDRKRLMDVPGGLLVIDALKHAWPCGK